MTLTQKLIACAVVEGLDEYGGKEPTIKRMLELLSQWEYWPPVHVQTS